MQAKWGEGSWRPREVGPGLGAGGVGKRGGGEEELGDKIILQRLENLPENLPSSPPPTLTPNSPLFANFLLALF